METNRELLFARTLEEVRSLAKEQGNCVSRRQVEEAFAQFELDEDRLKLIYDYLDKHHVGIDRPADPDEYLTEAERDYLQNYLDELSALPEYTPGQVEAYTISAMAGDAGAQGRLAEIYLKDVVEVAKLYAGQGVCTEDLIGEGNAALVAGVGLLGSLESPDEAQGMLGRMMMNAMEDIIAETAKNREADKKAEDRVNKVAKQAGALAEELRRKVTVEELARETGMSESRIREAMRISGFMIGDLTDE
ncbi:MAG: hypothetical protein NC079_02600 [Clostridium sp.]|nr:hypothetical protein [Acetatifactor muris]MCM1527196.1 hypothetical protein [Bacteroides sp.]MCM1562479.1 hypothetical protein [Clostridium sp.]